MSVNYYVAGHCYDNNPEFHIGLFVGGIWPTKTFYWAMAPECFPPEGVSQVQAEHGILESVEEFLEKISRCIQIEKFVGQEFG